MRAVLLAAILCAAFFLPVPAVSAAGPPGLSADPGEAAPGTSVRVRGSAWAPGTTVQIQICGANAVHGSADCDTERGVTAMIAPTGAFEAGLSVGAPPAACPCVIKVGTLPGAAATPVSATVAFKVLGHRVAPVLKDVVPVRADIVGAELVGGGSRSELFGGAPRRTLVLEVRNAGAEPVVDAPLVVGWGAGDEPDSPLDAPKTGTLAPGKTATYRIPVELPRASFGQFVVGGRYAGSVPFKATFSTYPWGLLAVNAFAALLLILGVRLALGRWAARRRRPAAPRTRGATAAGLAPAHHQMVAPRSGLDTDDLLDHLDRTARTLTGEYVVDRAELISYLESRRQGPVDLDALDRFLALDRFAPGPAEPADPAQGRS